MSNEKIESYRIRLAFNLRDRESILVFAQQRIENFSGVKAYIKDRSFRRPFRVIGPVAGAAFVSQSSDHVVGGASLSVSA